MSTFLDVLKTIPNAVLRPKNFFSQKDRNMLYYDALKALGIVLLICTVVLFLTAALNAGKLQNAALALSAAAGPGGVTGTAKFIPWTSLLFPVLTAVYVFAAALMRHGTLVLLGEKEKSLPLAQALTIYGALTAIALSAAAGSFANLFPQIPVPGRIPSMGAAGVASGAAVLAGLVVEAWVAVQGFRSAFGQNVGRAVILWLSPAFCFTALMCGIGMAVGLAAVIRS